ncbi:MAG: 1-acyl-sn-glycerol-3-phosphate acyltransferase [Ruminococcaceae bacterium]|nr:1-acyl-sn-glycerol-3-phosphate acyltransferase [Oscillospiraceae bacterium]
MKIKCSVKSYAEVIALPRPKHRKPKKPNILFRTLVRVASMPDLISTHCSVERVGMDKLGRREPCLVLMNHSSFIDLKIASKILYPRPYNIVCTTDGFVGKNWLMRQIGCIPTKKYVNELSLIKDMAYAVKELKSSVLMYPEAGYSFDGTATTLPDSIGKFIKMLGVPVVVITTYGAFARDPLYNNLQLRRVRVSARAEYTLSAEDTKSLSSKQINEMIREKFSFDGFRWQQENKIRIDEPFRADFLNRVLYKCPACGVEGKTEGKGTHLTCKACGKSYELDEYGFMRATDGDTEFSHIPDWYAWERAEVRREIERGEYSLDVPVDIYALVNTDSLYKMGEGRLTHTAEGFTLTGCDGALEYRQKPLSSYSLNSDYYWYSIGDMISIGDRNILYYCFPKDGRDVVAKIRLAAEELYKIAIKELRSEKNNTAKENE